MATKPEIERLSVVETKVDRVVDDVAEVRLDVKTILSSLEDSYVKKSEFSKFKWTTVPLTIVATVVITFLATSFLQSLHKTDSAARDTTVNPSTSSTTTTTTPTGSTSTTKTDGTTGTSTPQPTNTNPNNQPNGGVNVTLPKVP